MTWHGTEIVGEKRANALHGIDLDAFTLPRPHSLFVCGVFVTHYKDKINKVMWAFAGDALKTVGTGLTTDRGEDRGDRPRRGVREFSRITRIFA